MDPEQASVPGTSGPPPTATTDTPGYETAALPLLRAGRWAIGFLLIAIALAIVFSQTMPEFFRAAYHLG